MEINERDILSRKWQRELLKGGHEMTEVLIGLALILFGVLVWDVVKEAIEEDEEHFTN